MSDQVEPVAGGRRPCLVGLYAPGMVFGTLVFVSGQAGRDPAIGLIAGPDVGAQTEQVLQNIAAILETAGSSLQHVLRCGVFLVDMREFPTMNEIYARAFGSHRPARTTVEVSGLPGDGLRVEIDAIAYIPSVGRRTLRRSPEGGRDRDETGRY